MRVTPSLPQRGKQTKGSSPLTPSCAKFSINLLTQRGPDEAPEQTPKEWESSQNSKELIHQTLVRITFLKIVKNVRIYSAIQDSYRALFLSFFR